MKRFAMAIMILLVACFVPNIGWGHHNSLRVCGLNGGQIIDAFVDQAFPPTPSKHFDRMPFAMNDIQCGAANNHTFNVAVVVTETSKELPTEEAMAKQVTRFGIFKIRFSKAGEVLLLSYEIMAPWEIFTKQNEKIIVSKWCDFIKKKYPNQLKDSGCP